MAGGEVIHSVSLRWSGFTSAGWGWTGKAWNRSQNGTPDLTVTGHRISVDNVIVMAIKTRFLGLHDVLGNASPDDVVTGRGHVWVFRNGRMIRGQWIHPTAKSRLRLMHGGKAIRLAPGHTWVELLPPNGNVTYSRR